MKFLMQCCLVIVLASCQSSKEVHFFKQGNNYYRVKINECAFLSSSRYVSGYYDDHALDNYFGEIHRASADSSGNFQRISADGTTARKDSNNVLPDYTKLVFILSTDSKAVSDQIGNFAQNEQTLEILARLSNKDVIKQNQEIKNNIDNASKQGLFISQFGDNTFNPINIDSVVIGDKSKINNQVLAFINYIGSMKGVTAPFTTIDDAYNWYINQFPKK